MEANSIDVNSILANKNLIIKFQPVVSVIKKSVIGLEAVCLGSSDDNGGIISTSKLFKTAEEQGVLIELDRLYREKAVKEFVKVYKRNKELLLFLDINISIIDKYVGSGIIMNLISDSGISTNNVVLQIIEGKMTNLEALKKFIYLYRSNGFLVALKDLGTGFANMDKISYVEPDIIKINSVLTKGIEVDYYRQEVFRSLVNLSKKIGALVVCEDIASEQETMMIMELGADMLEGSYFENDFDLGEKFLDASRKLIDATAVKYEKYTEEEVKAKEMIYSGYDFVINEALKELSSLTEDKFDDSINTVINKNSKLECVYVLNKEGIQVGSTATRFTDMVPQRALIFEPAQKGTNHSLKKYYYFLKTMSLNKYVTEPYISLATGNLCITISAVFKNLEGKEYILCVDFNPNYMSM
ncbi:EAL domain-containing protein (putative c-di-GMP-specific phosphodiesterase class I) [Clostridium acetobutylicum]|uniref:Sensory protein, containing EAL-domain n=1 Tax=Clostridium acetobutylicum (strain ATCC 824 / DSM 792 / JCM 1419 / IAM 19013 / LMG 5710 / NBRC 13948 / NRRL B-527 / VKM B-1787 / 2291 / W) TaxID=272562 RepID=Q97M76_CLOAB|nr:MULTISPECIES: EAL domain-containing protein [Clostridium]AAK78303.1 Sensory protein, containing EAL-domain [Clostridium acetobutylicum ATCC 824]ADZ19372.1 Sensory protein, containing EAL-domain [Clostridium acetobutylicum EA 2018]AEI31168.1 sensor protein [Clostridium acetobutylicum DSM 1731]AWV80029.1 EAL domain-containing protein [Clostridium acetobutylicum]MBC2395847.1 EAL domain-containing protein [Clostridium acetobutylicum]